ncbi:MAG: hypothetical protein IJX76_03780, partial [Clostridia bacterium]|nr:hypothetical protein [Clostridia bacterium]
MIAAHTDREDLLAVWLPNFLPYAYQIMWGYYKGNASLKEQMWFADREEIVRYYDILRELYNGMKSKERVFSPCIFPWYEAKLEKAEIAQRLCALAYMSREESIKDAVCPLIKECSCYLRDTVFESLLSNPHTPTQRRAVVDGLVDKDNSTRTRAYNIAGRMRLTAEEYLVVESHLRYKSSDIRQQVMDLLLRQDNLALMDSISRLLLEGKEESRCGALDMLINLQKDNKRSGIVAALLPRLIEMAGGAKVTTKEKILLEELLPKEDETEEVVLCTDADYYLPTEFDEDYIKLCAETFARYFPDSQLPRLLGQRGAKPSLFAKIAEAVTGKDAPTCERARMDILSLSRFIDANQTVSIRYDDGDEALLGSAPHLRYLNDGSYTLSHLWDRWAEENGITNERILRAIILLCANDRKTPYLDGCRPFVCSLYGNGFDRAVDPRYMSQIVSIFNHYLMKKIPQEDLSRLASAVAAWLVRCVPDDKVLIHAPIVGRKLPVRYEMAHLLAHMQIYRLYRLLTCQNDETLPKVFPLAVASVERCVQAFEALPVEEFRQDYRSYVYASNRYPGSRRLKEPAMTDGYYIAVGDEVDEPVDVSEYLLAAHQGIITRRQLYQFLLQDGVIANAIRTVSDITAAVRDRGRVVSGQMNNGWRLVSRSRMLSQLIGHDGELTDDDIALCDLVEEVYNVLIPMVMEPELRRGDSPAKYTSYIRNITRLYGAENFAAILHAMGSDTLGAGSYGDDRRNTLPHLLSVCIPAVGETAENFRKALEGKKIIEKRLIEAALYSPEWIPLIGEYLHLPAFESVCYYFMAHMNERFDAKRRAMIARYTPLTEEELNQGAFDIGWFRTAYEAMDEKVFDLIYTAAKYITDGARHTRARKYADAALGKFTVSETEATISDKRNKDLLMAYALIP